jgi:hypothetical protein
MKDERAIDWKEGFPNFHWTRRASSRRVLEVYQMRERSILCFGGKKKEEKESVRRRLIFYVWKGVVKKKKMCANKSMEGSCV